MPEILCTLCEDTIDMVDALYIQQPDGTIAKICDYCYQKST